MSAKGKEFRVNVSTNRATAISNSAGSYPNVLYFPIDDSNVIIFNGNIYDWNASTVSPKQIGNSENLNNYNTLSKLGVYYSSGDNSITNKPSGVNNFALQVFKDGVGDTSVSQTLYANDVIYARRYNGTSWTSWTEIGAGGITSIPQASSSALGGIKIGYSDNGKNYAVELDSSGKAYVNVPWTDTNTTYNVATTSANGLMSSSDKSKLNGIQAGADAVSFSRSLSSGTKIGTININGTNTDIYAPTYSAGTGLSLSGTTFSLGKATPTTLGGVKVSSTEIITISTVAATTSGSQNRIYPVQLAYPSGSAGTDGNKVLSVYVPWENTTYGIATSSKSGLFGASDKADFDRIRSAWVNGAVFVNESSPLYNLAIREAVGGGGEYLAYFGDDGVLEKHMTIDVNYIPVINKSNNWSAYQDFKSGAGNSGSDMRFKKEVTCMPDVLDNLMSLNVIKYIWEHPDENGIRCTFGVKADQLLSLGGVYATMVHSRADKYDTKWVEYDRFGVLAIKALQEVVMRNKQLESRIEYLEDTINSMRRVWEENS